MQSPSSEHLSPRQVASFRERTLPPEERLSLDAHIAACDACRHLLRPDATAEGILRQFEEGLFGPEAQEIVHLTYEEMTACLDAKADAVTQEIVDGHLEVCAGCRRELEELRQVQSTLSLGGAEVLKPTLRLSLIQKVIQGIRAAKWHLATEASLVTALLLLFVRLQKPPLMPGVAVTPPDNSQIVAELKRQMKNSEAVVSDLHKQNDQANSKRRAAEAQVASLMVEKRNAHAEAASLLAKNRELDARNHKLANAPANRDARVVVAETGGGRLVRGKDGLAMEIPVPPGEEKFFEASLKDGRLAYTAAQEKRQRELVGGEQTTAGGGSGDVKRLRVLRPIASDVLEDTPAFAWEPIQGATRYEVHVKIVSNSEEVLQANLTKQSDGTWLAKVANAGEAGQILVLAGEGGALQWTPAKESRLRRSLVYSWGVRAYDAEDHLLVSSAVNRSVKFRIVSESKAAEVRAGLQRYAQAPPLIRALYLADHLLLDAAALELRDVVRDEPAGGTTHRVLEDIQKRRKVKSK